MQRPSRRYFPRTRPEPLQAALSARLPSGPATPALPAIRSVVTGWRCFSTRLGSNASSLRGIRRGAHRALGWQLPVRARSFRTEVPQDDAWIGPQPSKPRPTPVLVGRHLILRTHRLGRILPNPDRHCRLVLQGLGRSLLSARNAAPEAASARDSGPLL